MSVSHSSIKLTFLKPAHYAHDFKAFLSPLFKYGLIETNKKSGLRLLRIKICLSLVNKAIVICSAVS